jgi:hypothetical protein
MNESTPHVPRWILLFGGFLALVGLGTGLCGVFAPTLFFNDFHGFIGWDEIRSVTTSWGIRNVGMALAMLAALVLRTPSALAVVFTMRLFTEASDLANALATGHGTMGAPGWALALGWIALLLVPEALAARWGWAHAGTRASRT